MNKTITSVFILLSALLVLFALGESIGRIGDLELAAAHPELFDEESYHLHYTAFPNLMYAHVVLGMLFLLCGAFQLTPYFRRNFIKAHRLIGKIFLITSLFVSSSAIIIAMFYPFGNYLESVATLVFGTYILFSTLKAYTLIRARKIIEHSYWVRRVFFVSLSIATIRGVMIFAIVFFDHSVKEAMGISFVIGFLIHFLLLELWISADRKKRRRETATL